MSEATLQLQLRQIRLEAQDICSYEFVAANGGSLPAFTAGAHIDLHLPANRVRSYSLANAPGAEGHYVVAVQRETEGRGGSAWMHDSLRVGQVLAACGPANDFPLDEAAPESVFIAGGIGITPVLSMIERLEMLGRPWRLFYAARTKAGAAFRARLQQLDDGRGRVVTCFGDERAQRLDLVRIASEAGPAVHLYCCGPARMIDAFAAATAARDPRTVHLERFAASEDPALDGGFTVRLHKSGRCVPVPPGQSLLDALLDADVPISYACSNGICGTCMTRVIAGVPDHRDDFLNDEEKAAGKTMLICCSGSKSPELVLDL